MCYNGHLKIVTSFLSKVVHFFFQMLGLNYVHSFEILLFAYFILPTPWTGKNIPFINSYWPIAFTGNSLISFQVNIKTILKCSAVIKELIQSYKSIKHHVFCSGFSSQYWNPISINVKNVICIGYKRNLAIYILMRLKNNESLIIFVDQTSSVL